MTAWSENSWISWRRQTEQASQTSRRITLCIQYLDFFPQCGIIDGRTGERSGESTSSANKPFNDWISLSLLGVEVLRRWPFEGFWRDEMIISHSGSIILNESADCNMRSFTIIRYTVKICDLRKFQQLLKEGEKLCVRKSNLLTIQHIKRKNEKTGTHQRTKEKKREKQHPNPS